MKQIRRISIVPVTGLDGGKPTHYEIVKMTNCIYVEVGRDSFAVGQYPTAAQVQA